MCPKRLSDSCQYNNFQVPDFGNIPLLYQNGATVYLKDVAKVTDAADLPTGLLM